MGKAGLALALIFLTTTSFAQKRFERLAPSKVQRYQVDSQYGPEISVLNALFPKEGKLELNVGGNLTAMSSLMDTAGVSGSLQYHFNKRHAIEPIWVQYNLLGDISSFVETEIRDKSKKAGVTNSDLGVEIPTMAFAASYIFTRLLFENAYH